MADQDASCGCCAASSGEKQVLFSYKYLANILLLLLFIKPDYALPSESLQTVFPSIENTHLNFYESEKHVTAVQSIISSNAIIPKSRTIVLPSSKENSLSSKYDLSTLGITSSQHLQTKSMNIDIKNITTTRNFEIKTSISSYFKSFSASPSNSKIIQSNISTSSLSSIPEFSTKLHDSSTTILQSTEFPVTPSSSSICISVITISSLCGGLSSLLTNSFLIQNSTTATSASSSIQVSLSTMIAVSNITHLASSIIASQSEWDISSVAISSIVPEINISSSIEPSMSSKFNISSAIVESAYIIAPATKYHKCYDVASNFSEALNNYTSCILLNLRPMEVCFKCYKQYDAMKQHHRKVYQECKKQLISSYNHKYQVVTKLFDLQKETWNSLECEKCYNYDTEPPLPTDAFIKFQKMHEETVRCFKNNTHSGSNQNTTNSTSNDVCSNCFDIYSKLQLNYKYQEDSAEESKTQWCADINVVVNDTRHRWSKVYKCGHKEKDLLSIIALTCFFCFLPIVFYVGAKLHSDVKERKS